MASNHIDDDEPGFFRRHLVLLILGGLGLASGGYMHLNHTPAKAAPKKKEMVLISPEPVIVTPQIKKEELPREVKKEEKDDKMIVQEEVPVEKPKAANTAPDKPSDEPLGTAIGGGDGSGLGNSNGSSNGGSRMIGGNNNGGGSKWGWYAGQVQNRLADALRSNPVTQRAGFSNTVQIWSDKTGRITRVKLNSSTGDGKVDAAIENEVFNGLVLNEPPPEGMPMPINLRLTAR